MVPRLITNPIGNALIYLFRRKSKVLELEEKTYEFYQIKKLLRKYNIYLNFFEYPRLDAPNSKTAIKITGNKLKIETTPYEIVHSQDDPISCVLFHGDQFRIQKNGFENFIFEVSFKNSNPPEFIVTRITNKKSS
ncbi:MAG: hypothetical protein SFU25_09015 [Candidatus Caenarcaniphilales bacterium]|nr:hypothetical protein [Candidatus Caenarcaniphilales bacterium]